MHLDDWLKPGTVTPWDVCFALLSVLLGWIGSNIAKRAVLAVLGRLRGLSPNATLLIVRCVRYAVLLLGVGIGLSFLGASTQPLLGIILVVGAVAVLTLRGVSANLTAGVLLQTRQPLRVGEEIQSDGFVGTVEEVNARAVVVRTRDGRVVHLPNDDLLGHPLVNHSRSGARRSEVEVRVGDPDVETARALTETVVAAVPGVHPEPPVQVLLTLAADDRVTFRVAFWHAPLAGPVLSSAVLSALARDLRRRGLRSTATSDLPPAPLSPPPAV